jgi:glycosidase
MAFLISRKSRDKYKFDESLFKPSGNASFSNFKSVQQFAEKLKGIRARAGEINAMGLMHEIFRHMVQLYTQQQNPQMLEKAVDQLQKELDDKTVDTALRRFAEEFPPLTVYLGEHSLDDYMKGTSEEIPHRLLLLEEMMMLWLTNINPAIDTYKKALFDDAKLASGSAYKKVIKELEPFFDSQPPFGPNEHEENLLTLLKAPAAAAPHSLRDQLIYIKDHWGEYLQDFLARMLTALDIMKEEEKFGGPGPGETPVHDFAGAFEDYERFSADHLWMPRLILTAKSSYVWLDQLSRKYNVHIHRLDQIPDEELDELANRGFTGLWLIGLWERSRASQKIKQMCGNPEAMASAYSIYDYRVADDLGGDEALNNLEHRAWQRGIRMASDMVPNHMGIDSPWVVEHPDWFLSLDYCPFPAYSFNGPNLSPDDRVSIFLEDHYYDRTDAAVVFKRVDNQTGEVRYIYHGNDGTSMPWNDTAQLNYLNPAVREAVTNTIFSVAERFPVIRFDAAMTLTKKHYQRLWFPEPGSGGDIPTRAGHGKTQQAFHGQMPEEFWRQVVDRFARAGSDTLLLAEAFWLMEAYFVRTLGMHRVYNSAFMNFLKNEDNEEFRTSIKNVLQFNPEILKRFVNFMNNPDEETAVAQFGKEDKYFGVCTLMATLPGLPMFGHGQIEGFAEKYGMEFRRAYWDEIPDQYLVQRHEREIFPLLRKRYLFADAAHFLFYDFYTPEGWVNEDVIAFSNRFADERCLVIYHNKFASAAGWIKVSVPQGKSLGEGLALEPNETKYTIFRDHAAGLEYIRNCKELCEKGLYVELEAYKKNVFLDFREVADDKKGRYAQLCGMLQGKGVPNIDEMLRKHFFNPLLEPFQELMDPEVFRRFDMAEMEEKARVFLEAVQRLSEGSGDIPGVVHHLRQELERLSDLPTLVKKYVDSFDSAEVWRLMEDWILTERISGFFGKLGVSEGENLEALRFIKVSTLYPDFPAVLEKETVENVFRDSDVRALMGVNEHEGTQWFHKESAERLFNWFFLVSLLDFDINVHFPFISLEEIVTRRFRTLRQLRRSVEQSGCQYERLIGLLLDVAEVFG